MIETKVEIERMDSPLCTFYHPVWSAPPVQFSHIFKILIVFIYRVAYIPLFLSIFSTKMEKKNFIAKYFFTLTIS